MGATNQRANNKYNLFSKKVLKVADEQKKRGICKLSRDNQDNLCVLQRPHLGTAPLPPSRFKDPLQV